MSIILIIILIFFGIFLFCYIVDVITRIATKAKLQTYKKFQEQEEKKHGKKT